MLRGASAKEHTASTRMLGLVDQHLLWAWDLAALGQGLESHASARLAAHRAERGERAVSASLVSRIPGAVLGDDGLPLHVGNPVAEQRRLRRDALVLLPRDVLRLTGPDRLPWLDSISSQSIDRLPAGASAETLVLSPEGRIEHVLRLRRDRRRALGRRRRRRGRCARGVADADALLQGGRHRAARRRSSWAPRASRPESLAWIDGWPEVAPGGVRYGEPTGEPWRWSEAILTTAEAEALDPARFVGTLAADALRIAAGRPALAEVDERSIPHELDWLTTAVHLSKGCYRGQETVAKVHNLGAPPAPRRAAAPRRQPERARSWPATRCCAATRRSAR